MQNSMKEYLRGELKQLEDKKLYKTERIIESPQGLKLS